ALSHHGRRAQALSRLSLGARAGAARREYVVRERRRARQTPAPPRSPLTRQPSRPPRAGSARGLAFHALCIVKSDFAMQSRKPPLRSWERVVCVPVHGSCPPPRRRG